MDFKLQTFFIEVTDFFPVLLPGALLTWYVETIFEKQDYLRNFEKNSANKTSPWLAFAAIAYLFGHILFVSASAIPDKIKYNWSCL